MYLSLSIVVIVDFFFHMFMNFHVSIVMIYLHILIKVFVLKCFKINSMYVFHVDGIQS